jgi:hypothetical protein
MSRKSVVIQPTTMCKFCNHEVPIDSAGEHLEVFHPQVYAQINAEMLPKEKAAWKLARDSGYTPKRDVQLSPRDIHISTN